MQCAEDLQRAWSELCALLERSCAARSQKPVFDSVLSIYIYIYMDIIWVFKIARPKSQDWNVKITQKQH